MSSTDTSDAPDAEVEEAPPTDEARETLLAMIVAEIGDSLVGSHIRPGDDLWVRVTRSAWADLASFLRSGLGFAHFNFLSGLDWMPSPFGRDMDSAVDNSLGSTDPPEALPAESGHAGGGTRFQVFARVDDVVNHRSVTAKVDVAEDDLWVPSWVPVYPGAAWHERECWEMYGISFDGHPGLRHIYLPGAFEGHPLRKDYPLLARRVKPWPGIVDVEEMPEDGEEDS